jgi:hypothetical protein
MTTNNSIDRYVLQYNAYSGNDADYIARISLYNQGQDVGTIDFYKEGQSIPINTELPGKFPGTMHVYLRMYENQLDRVVDMLRCEKPNAVIYDSATLAYVTTGVEPIGEEES